jgi:hypothetical protein
MEYRPTLYPPLISLTVRPLIIIQAIMPLLGTGLASIKSISRWA